MVVFPNPVLDLDSIAYICTGESMECTDSAPCSVGLRGL